MVGRTVLTFEPLFHYRNFDTMTRTARLVALVALPWLAATAAPALAQYPPGYGGQGWHGWGGGSSSGRTAAGMGVFAAGAGQRNMDNSQARATNAQTAMGVNNYMWECNQRNIQMYQARLAMQQADNIKALGDIQDRILNHPIEYDIASGDTLNALMGELTNPIVYGKTIDLAQRPLKSAMIKRIPFESASAGITYSIKDLTDGDDIPAAFLRPEFDAHRQNVRALAKQMLDESTEKRAPSSATIKKFRTALDGVKKTLDSLNLDAGVALEAHRFLKALYGLTKMIDSPSYDVYLAAVDQVPETPLCEVLIFMHAFNLQFGPSKDAQTREMYSQLYAMLSDLRDQVNPPRGAAQAAGAAGPKSDSRVTNFYGGMPYQPVMAPNGPPQPGQQ
jgi:hypothetical protein